MVYDLKYKNIISNGDLTTITRNPDAKQRNEFLLDRLYETCDEEALIEVCDMLIDMQGNRKMNALGRDMKCQLEKGIANYGWCCMSVHAPRCV